MLPWKLSRARDVHQQIAPYRSLASFFDFLAEWVVVPLSEDAADQFVKLRSQKIRIGTQDLKNASIALGENALLLSANLGDFQKAPRLRVENWLR